MTVIVKTNIHYKTCVKQIFGCYVWLLGASLCNESVDIVWYHPNAHIYLMLCLLHSSKMIIKVSVCDNFIFSRQNNYNEIECVSYSCYDLIFQNNRLVWNIENSPNYEDKSLICKPKHYLQIEFPILWQLKSWSLSGLIWKFYCVCLTRSCPIIQTQRIPMSLCTQKYSCSSLSLFSLTFIFSYLSFSKRTYLVY